MLTDVADRSALPLEHFSLFESRDVDEAREFVARVFCPHELVTTRPGARLEARHHHAPLHRDVSLNYVQYGAEVRIEPGYLKDFYLLQIPLRGHAAVRCGGQKIQAHDLQASFPSPTMPLRMVWAEDSPHLIVKFDRHALQARLEALLQDDLMQPLVFELGVDLRTAPMRALVELIGYVRGTLENRSLQVSHPLLAEQTETHLLSSILLAASHNHSARLTGKLAGQRPCPTTVLPRVVRRAQEFMCEHEQLPITLADVCNDVGASARSLQDAFNRHTGSGPMTWLRDRRLDQVRRELMQPGIRFQADTSPIAQIASRYGFFHLGHFAAAYRIRFGELPSQTRERRRAGFR